MRRFVTVAGRSLRNAWERIAHPWNVFWFQPADPLPLAVMRILFGGMLLYTHAVWGLNLEGFFGPRGWQSESLVRLLQQDQFVWSYWWWVPGGLRSAVYVGGLTILLLNLLGAFTPVTSILAYLIIVGDAYRAPTANFGLDQILAIGTLYLAIGPSGQALSVDRLWSRSRKARDELRLGQPLQILPAPKSARANLALRLFQVHLCVIYVFACLSKLQGESWWNGLAIWQAVSNLEYQSRDLTWLAWYPWLINILTHATIIWEITFWTLVWKPFFRAPVLLIGTAIHLGIGAFMGMWTFGLIMVFAYVAFIPVPTLAAVLAFPTRLANALMGAAPQNVAIPSLDPDADVIPAKVGHEHEAL
jgi:hypothetical protein